MRTYERETEKQEYMQDRVNERERACDRGAKERRRGVEDECTHSR